MPLPVDVHQPLRVWSAIRKQSGREKCPLLSLVFSQPELPPQNSSASILGRLPGARICACCGLSRNAELSHLDGHEAGRFLPHVLPKGLPRIRYFGWLANRRRHEMLPLCRTLLAATPPTAVERGNTDVGQGGHGGVWEGWSLPGAQPGMLCTTGRERAEHSRAPARLPPP